MLSALLLALASSTDNFAVGLTVGLARKPLSPGTNGIISLCNAMGATFASWGGSGFMAGNKSLFSIIASLVFFYLAYQEIRDNDQEKEKGGTQREEVSIAMAIPMTLNNLVGGVAGGAVGILPMIAGISALVASYSTMSLGFWMGRQTTSTLPIQPSQVSSILFVVLGILSLVA
mmetsp:Transcript_13885/g.20494  ORF Transcript_13885/g.20494 Transcript_13885/m.20494 type:complete len:174 (-) Transcript_13885:352-873(-)